MDLVQLRALRAAQIAYLRKPPAKPTYKHPSAAYFKQTIFKLAQKQADPVALPFTKPTYKHPSAAYFKQPIFKLAQKQADPVMIKKPKPKPFAFLKAVPTHKKRRPSMRVGFARTYKGGFKAEVARRGALKQLQTQLSGYAKRRVIKPKPVRHFKIPHIIPLRSIRRLAMKKAQARFPIVFGPDPEPEASKTQVQGTTS